MWSLPALPRCLWPLGARLGEGPLWHADEQALYFVDVKAPAVHRCAADGSARQSWTAPAQVGFVQRLAGGGLLCGLQGGLYRFDPGADGGAGRFECLLPVEAQLPGNRLNDATVDPAGRLWFGSMDDGEAQVCGSLYRLGAAGRLHTADSGICITNGPAISPDGRTLYHTDTLAKSVHAFELTAEGGVSNKRLFVATAGSGWPDGSTVDAEGCLWVAFFGGGRVERYSPRGERLGAVQLPCSNVTKLAFGGPGLRTAFVTTATKGLTPQQRAEQPLAGALFSFDSPVPGLPAHAVSQGFAA